MKDGQGPDLLFQLLIGMVKKWMPEAYDSCAYPPLING